MAAVTEVERIAVLEETYRHIATKADFAEFKADIRSDLVAHQHATQEEFKSVRAQQTIMANEIAGLKAEFRVIKGLVLVAIGIVIAQFVALWFGLLPLSM